MNSDTSMPACRKRSTIRPTAFSLSDHVQAALGGQLLAAFGHQRGLVGLDFAGNVGDRVHGGHFEIEPVRHDRTQQTHVAVLDVPAILAQMDGDAVGAAQHGQHGGGNGVGFVSPPRLPHGGDVIDVDAEANHRRFRRGSEPHRGRDVR